MSESVISGFPRGVTEVFALLGFYEAYSGNSIPTFRDNLSVPSSRIKQSKKMGLIGCPETLVTTDLRCITSQKSEDLIYMSENYLLYFGIWRMWWSPRFFRNVGTFLADYGVPHPRMQHSSGSELLEAQISPIYCVSGTDWDGWACASDTGYKRSSDRNYTKRNFVTTIFKSEVILLSYTIPFDALSSSK